MEDLAEQSAISVVVTEAHTLARVDAACALEYAAGAIGAAKQRSLVLAASLYLLPSCERRLPKEAEIGL